MLQINFQGIKNSVSSLNLFFGLSRTPHGLLDVATPAMAAMLQLGHFPELSTIIIGLIAAFSGYTAVYAMNDLIDVRIDRERLELRKVSRSFSDIDTMMVEHPVAKGLLSFKNGLLWFIFWASIALIAIIILNPVCLLIFFISAVCEWLYCKLIKITHWKIIPSAIVKASGGLAGVYAVSPEPDPRFVALIFLWLACWEIGGQNVANDIVDLEDDLHVGAKTMVTVKGLNKSVYVLLVATSMATFAGVVIFLLAGQGVGWIYPVGASVLGYLLILAPSRMVYESPSPATAALLFNRASFMPIAFLALTVISIWIRI
ncbi:MAG: UbiA family prenyltransferase [Desulfomonilaceae bacterium]